MWAPLCGVQVQEQGTDGTALVTMPLVAIAGAGARHRCHGRVPLQHVARWQASGPHLDLGRAPYVLYGVIYIDLVSLYVTLPKEWHRSPSLLTFNTAPLLLGLRRAPMSCMVLNI